MSIAWTLAVVVMFGTVAWQGLLIVALFRRCQEVEELITGLEVDAGSGPRIDHLVPAIRQRDARSGAVITLDLFAGRSGALLFVSAGCGACRRVLEGLASGPGEDGRLIVLFKGALASLPAPLPASIPLVVLRDEAVIDAFRVAAFPDLVVINGDNTLAQRAHPTSYESFRGVLDALPPAMDVDVARAS